MKKTLIYLIFAVFLALIVQPNIRGNLSQGDQRVPTNTTNGTPATNDTIELKADVKDITICVDAAQQSGSDQDINLAMAEAIGKKLEDSGFQVVYTRQDATTLSNDERLSLARNDKEVIFISNRNCTAKSSCLLGNFVSNDTLTASGLDTVIIDLGTLSVTLLGDNKDLT